MMRHYTRVESRIENASKTPLGDGGKNIFLLCKKDCTVVVEVCIVKAIDTVLKINCPLA